MSGVVAGETQKTHTGIPVLHAGSHFRHGLLQLMIHTIDPMHDGKLLLLQSFAETPEVGGHVPPQVLGYQLTLFRPRGADYARHITTGPPSFWTMRRLLQKNVVIF